MNEFLTEINTLGIWGMINTSIVIGGAILGILFLFLRKKRVRDLNFYITWIRNPDNRFPLVLHFEIRNLSQHMIVINSPYFKFGKLKPGPYAHCDSVSGEYEIKFKRDESQLDSEIACLLRHRDIVSSYVPLDENQTDEDLVRLNELKKIGKLFCNIILLTRKSQIIRFKLKVKGIVANKANEYLKLNESNQE